MFKIKKIAIDTSFKINKLKGSINYNIQSIRVEAILIKEGIINTIYTNIVDESLINTSAKALSIIKLSLEDRPLLQTRFINNPKDLQDNLKSLYKSKGFSSEFILSKDLINNTINSNKGNLETYINSFTRINNSLVAKSINLPNKFLVALLLNNLSNNYNYIVANITQNIRTTYSNNLNLDNIII